jgi:cell shape-determining protein MreC
MGAVAHSYLASNIQNSTDAMKIFLADYKDLLAENAQLRQENTNLQMELEIVKEDYLLNYFLPKAIINK